MAVIEVENLTKWYGRTRAVDDIAVTVERGQVFGFLGPNGSGKTTTIGMLLGVLTPTAGRIRLLGESGARGLHRARQRIGATLETPNFYPYLSGRDNLRIAANVKRAAASDIEAALDTVRLTARARDRFKAYSLGMKQRLALAAAMLGDPELIILDEPATGLDPEGMREIREIILELAARGKTLFLSSHLLSEVERICTHVAIIRRGRIVRQASIRDLTAATVVAELRASDGAALGRAVAAYDGTIATRDEGDAVIVELKDDDLAALNAFLAGRGVFLSHLSLKRRSLEDAFIELTAGGGLAGADVGAGGAA